MDKKQEDTSLMHDFNQGSPPFFSGKFILFLIVVVLLGIGSGYLLSKNGGVSVGQVGVSNSSGNVTGKGTVVGSNDTKTFKDSTEGKLENGGIEGEGQYHLVRPGGESQNVYLISSVIDLSKFVGKKIKVWGATQTAQKAGWLMDVGKIEVLE